MVSIALPPRFASRRRTPTVLARAPHGAYRHGPGSRTRRRTTRGRRRRPRGLRVVIQTIPVTTGRLDVSKPIGRRLQEGGGLTLSSWVRKSHPPNATTPVFLRRAHGGFTP